jgi:S1-C subfamily serine protease
MPRMLESAVASLRRTVPYLGIEWQVQAGDDAAETSCDVAVKRVIAGSPACKSGIRTGDVIRSVDGALLNADQTLTDVILLRRPGTAVNLELARGSRRMNVKVVLGARELPEFRCKLVEQRKSVDVHG